MAFAGGSVVNQAGETRSAGVESARAVAAISVLASHAMIISRNYAAPTYVERLTYGGVYGVYLFFALSGYLLFWPFAQAAWGNRRPVDLRRYGINRAWRILPLYYTVLVVLLLVQYHGGSLRLWVAFLTFTQDFSGKTLGLVDAPMWSVATEVQFYIALPLIAWGLVKVSRGSLRTAAIALAALAVPTFAARQLIRYGLPVYSNLQYLDDTLLECFCYFAFGMGLAILKLSIQTRRPRWLDGPLGSSTTWLAAALLFWMFACYRASWEIASGVASMLLVGALVLPLRHGRAIMPFRWRPLALLGIISYGIYLWHGPILVAISNRSLTSTTLVIGRGLTELIGIGFPLTVAVATLTYWQVERRGLARRRVWSANAAGGSPAAAAASTALAVASPEMIASPK